VVIDQPPASSKRGLLNCFIAVHVVILFLWGLPGNNFLFKARAPVARYVLFTGLWHRWSMFAPSLYKVNYDMRARVEFKDGSVKEWIWPRMEELSVWQRIPKERFRKWRELMFKDTLMATWRSNAKFIARQMNSNSANPPVKVTLVRFWSPIAPPNLKVDYQPLPKKMPPTKSRSIGAYPISARDLE
jgi:hypothetical protein